MQKVSKRKHLRKALDKVNVGERKQIAEAKPECESMAVSAAELIISKTVDAKRGNSTECARKEG